MPLKIEKIVYPGISLARDNGLTTFLNGGLPGEEVEVEIVKKKKSFQEGRVLRVVEPSPERITPRCPSFGRCGGCSFQHTAYENQLRIKDEYVRELLQNFSIPQFLPILPSPEIWNYRNKMEFSFFETPSGPAEAKGEVTIGLHEKGAYNRYFPVPPCFIADQDFLKIVEEIQAFARRSGLQVYNPTTHQGFYRHLVLRKSKRTGQVLVNLVTTPLHPPYQGGQSNTSFFDGLVQVLKDHVSSFHWTVNNSVSDAVKAEEVHLLSGEPMIQEQMQIGERLYRFFVSPFSFFQTNTFGAEKLYETTLNFLDPKADDKVLDLYCGTGTIGLTLAPYVKQVLGVEQVPDAILDAKRNKEINAISNIDFEVGSVEKWIKHGTIPEFNALVIDPPRGGVSNKVIDFILRTKPTKIVYVSCNPSTLARDLALILRDTDYKIDLVQAVDMFPQTYHVEVVVRLTRIKK